MLYKPIPISYFFSTETVKMETMFVIQTECFWRNTVINEWRPTRCERNTHRGQQGELAFLIHIFTHIFTKKKYFYFVRHRHHPDNPRCTICGVHLIQKNVPEPRCNLDDDPILTFCRISANQGFRDQARPFLGIALRFKPMQSIIDWIDALELSRTQPYCLNLKSTFSMKQLRALPQRGS